MTDDQQAGTLAFLQNFYTDITLYMPFEAEERAPLTPAAAATAVAVPAAAAVPIVAVAVPVIAAAAPVAAPAPVATATPAPVAPPIPMASVPAVVAEPAAIRGAGQLPSLATSAPLRPVPAAPPAAPATPPPAAPVVEAPYLRTTFSTLGSNARGVVLLVRLPEAQFLKLPRNVFLNKLLQAIQLVMADVVLVNVDGPYPVALANLRQEIAATHVLAFGKNLLDVAVRTTQIYEPVLFPNLDLAYLAAAEVEMVEYDVSLKKRLWSGLQAMFLQA